MNMIMTSRVYQEIRISTPNQENIGIDSGKGGNRLLLIMLLDMVSINHLFHPFTNLIHLLESLTDIH